jgi:acetoacetyl-CoA synthetase
MLGTGDDVLWEPTADLCRDSGLADFLTWLEARHRLRFATYQSLWRWSVDHLDDFWACVDDFEGLGLADAGRPVLAAPEMPGARWFPGATLNYAGHIFRRAGAADDAALICVGEEGGPREVTWGELRQRVGSLAASLRSWGVRKGDRVAGYLPNTAEAVIAFLASASIGAVWSVCAPEFGTGAVLSRFRQLRPKVLIAASGYRNGGRAYDRAADVAEIAAAVPGLERVVWVDVLGQRDAPALGMPLATWASAISEPAEPRFEQVEFGHPLWVLFSSGTTGLPKGIVHGHGGILLEHLKVLRLHTDLRPGDRFLFLGSTSWMVWNLLVSGLLVGATLVLVDGSPAYPDLSRLWRIAAEQKVAVLGVGAGLIQSSEAAGLHPGADFDLARLRSLLVTGSPLPPDGFRWVYGEVSRTVWLASCSGGTDVCSAFVGGVPLLPVRAGRIQAPCLGVAVAAWDDDGMPLAGAPGELVVTRPMPSMPLSFWDDPGGKRYRDSYFATFPGVWRHGDYIEFDEDGSSVIHGRSDSTLNRRGIRMGPAEIYAAVERVPEVAEALVVGAELGAEYYMPLFVTLTAGADPDAARAHVRDAIRTALSPRHVPDEIVVMPGIPHNRMGKKLEVPVKRLLQGARLSEVVDLDAVDDPGLMASYQEFARHRTAQVAQAAQQPARS